MHVKQREAEQRLLDGSAFSSLARATNASRPKETHGDVARNLHESYWFCRERGMMAGGQEHAR